MAAVDISHWQFWLCSKHRGYSSINSHLWVRCSAEIILTTKSMVCKIVFTFGALWRSCYLSRFVDFVVIFWNIVSSISVKLCKCQADVLLPYIKQHPSAVTSFFMLIYIFFLPMFSRFWLTANNSGQENGCFLETHGRPPPPHPLPYSTWQVINANRL